MLEIALEASCGDGGAISLFEVEDQTGRTREDFWAAGAFDVLVYWMVLWNVSKNEPRFIKDYEPDSSDVHDRPRT